LRCFEFGPGPAVTVSSVETTRTALEDLDNMLMLFYTGKTRQASSILSQQKSNIAGKVEILKQMTRQAHQVRRLVERGDIDGLGAVLHQGWEAKRNLAQGVSSSELDEIYERAVKAGAIGGKISGAGGGGFFLLCVPSDKRQSVRQALGFGRPSRGRSRRPGNSGRPRRSRSGLRRCR
jgi:D-glycero-alpha-D-manno-heptose-7-phosphate kinase